MREDGGLTSYGMATVLCDVPALECIHATLPAALWPGHVHQPEAVIVPEITSIVRRPAPGLAVRIRFSPKLAGGLRVQVSVTVEPPAGGFTACVVRT